MTAHDGLGSVRADRRKDAAERTRPEPRGVDVAEGRRLLALVNESRSMEDAYEANDWLLSNAAALLDAAEERDRAVARESALRSRVEGLAVEWSRLAEAPIDQGPGFTARPTFRSHARDLRALLSPEDQS